MQEAITETFSRRGTPLEKELYIFTGEFKTGSNKQKQWLAFLNKLKEPLSYEFSEIVSRIENFIFPVWEKICCEGEFFGSWNFELQIWEL